MKFRFFSDPHVGVNRQANTSVESRGKIARYAASTPGTLILKDEYGICLGDVFDRYKVDPKDMLRTLQWLHRCQLVLSGNHDTINDASAVGSLQLMAHVTPNARFVKAEYGKTLVDDLAVDYTRLYSVPHVTTQPLFEQCLELVYDDARKDPARHKLLLLHCNYDFPPDRLTSAELNLTREDAEALIEDCGLRILIGHMHKPAEHLGGNLIIVGSTTNTGFADLSDKRTLLYDTETGELTSETHWHLENHAAEINWKSITGSILKESVQFLTLTGKVDPDEIFELSDLQRRLWKELPNLLALRDSTDAVSGSLAFDVATQTLSSSETFEHFLLARMPDDAMKTLFQEVQSRAK